MQKFRTIAGFLSFVLVCTASAQAPSVGFLDFHPMNAAKSDEHDLTFGWANKKVALGGYIFSYDQPHPQYWLEGGLPELNFKAGPITVTPGLYGAREGTQWDGGAYIWTSGEIGRVRLSLPLYVSRIVGVKTPCLRFDDTKSSWGIESNFAVQEHSKWINAGPSLRTSLGSGTVRISYLCPISGGKGHQLRLYTSFPIK